MTTEQHHKRIFPGLITRQKNYLLGVPDKDKDGRTKPGSQNRKKSGKSKRIEITNNE